MSSIQYKVIADYPNYMINSDGEVMRRLVSGNLRAIKPWFNGSHLQVTLTNKEGKRHFYPHRLVLTHWGPKQPKHLPLALHLDDDPFNNTLANLVWGDKRMNAQMAVANNKMMPHALKKVLTPEEAAEVIEAHRSGQSMTSISKRFGCSRWTVSNIVNHRVAKFL